MKRKNFYKLINSLNLNGNAVEIGVAKGNFSEKWIPYCNFKKNYLIDSWKHYETGYNDGQNKKQEIQDQRYKYIIEKFKNFGEKVIVIRQESLIASGIFENDFFDFIYIDANHDYQYVKDDLNAWYCKCRIGGLFSGHDYGCEGHRGVKGAVDEFAEKNSIKINVCNERDASWWFIKK